MNTLHKKNIYYGFIIFAVIYFLKNILINVSFFIEIITKSTPFITPLLLLLFYVIVLIIILNRKKEPPLIKPIIIISIFIVDFILRILSSYIYSETIENTGLAYTLTSSLDNVFIVVLLLIAYVKYYKIEKTKFK
ncbi:MAG: hypothetical protein ACOXZK_04995 [Bacteroidales bacterium]